MGKWGAWSFGLIFTVLLGVAAAHDFGGPSEPNAPPLAPPGGCPSGMCCRGGGGTGGGPGFGGAGVGDPVWAYDGSLHMRYTDLEIGTAFPIRITRSYDSRSEFDTALGYGWAFEHDRRLFEYPDGSVVIRSGCGRRDRYVNTGGAYVTPRDGLQGGLKELPDGSYEYRYADGKRDLFDADGRLAVIENQAGQRQELLYDPRGRLPLVGTSPRAVDPTKPMVVAYQPRLTRIQERSAEGALSGYSVSFFYDDNTGRLTRIVASDGRWIDYGHDAIAGGTRGNLRTIAGAGDYIQGFSYLDPLDTHNMTAIVDGANAEPVVNTYNNKGQVTRQVHGGSTLELAYLSPGRTQVTEIVKSAVGEELQRRVSTREFDEAGYLSKEINPLGHEQRFFYNATKDRIRTELWEKQPDASLTLLKTINNTYNGSAQKLTESVTLDSGEIVASTWTYDHGWVASEQTISTADPTQLFRTEYEFIRDTQGVPINIAVVKRRDDDGSFATTTYTYCSVAEASAPNSTCPDTALRKVVDGPRIDVNDITQYAYYGTTDSSGCNQTAGACHRRGDLRLTTDALGRGVEYLRYDASGRATRVRDANGVITDLTYHSQGWLLERAVRGLDDVVTTDDAITSYDYDVRGNLKRQTQADGTYVDFVYDTRNRLIETRDATGGKVVYTLDSAGNRWKEQTFDANGALRRTQSQTFDLLNRTLTHTGAEPNTTRATTYDGAGRQTILKDPHLVETWQTYDDLDRQIRTVADAGTDGIQVTSQFAYDAVGNLRQVVDPKNLPTTYQYNALGQLTQLTSPDTGTSVYTNDAAGNRRTSRDARNETATYTYDALNRLTSIGYSDPALAVSYGYDVSAAVCPAGETFAKGRVAVMTDNSGNTQYCYDRFGNLVRKVQTTGGMPFTLRYAYTKANQLQSITYPDGTLVDYERDVQGRISEVGVTQLSGDRQVLVTGATYYPFGPGAGWRYGNARQLIRQYDLDYQPLSIRDADTGGLDLGFGFDAAGHLTRLYTADLRDPPRSRFDYDTLGRLTRFRDGPTDAAIDTYSYDDTGNRLSHTGAGSTQVYSYPGNSHRLAQIGSASRSYDAAGNTTDISDGLQAFTYDPTGRMTQTKHGVKVTANYEYNGRGEQVRRYLGAGSTRFVYNETGQLLGQYDAQGALLQAYIWLDNMPVGVITNSEQLWYVEPDHLGTPRSIIDPAVQKAVWTWDLGSEVFGDSMPNTDPDSDGIVFVFDLRFPGQRYDAASGLNQNYYRDYDTEAGRYVQSDPIGLRGGLSTFGYVKNGPIGSSDPLGLLIMSDSCLSQGYETKIRNAEKKIEDKLSECDKKCSGIQKGRSCVKCDDVNKIRRKLRRSRIDCSKSGPYCGSAGLLQWSVTIRPAGWKPELCGCLENTLFHEILHNAGYDHPGDPADQNDPVNKTSNKCFPCGV